MLLVYLASSISDINSSFTIQANLTW
jgi:hypothetical protein